MNPETLNRLVARVGRERAIAIEHGLQTIPGAAELLGPATFLEGQRTYRWLWDNGHTMLFPRRARALFRLARSVERRSVPGALVDTGTWNGGSTALLGAGAPSRPLWAFDSFQGLPEPGPLDGDESAGYGGQLAATEEMVRTAVATRADSSKLTVKPGWFEDTVPVAAAEIGPIAVLHCDGDWYDSVLLVLETLYDQISPGGYIVIDDYGHWVGAQRATDEFRARVGERGRLVKIDYTGRYWKKSG